MTINEYRAILKEWSLSRLMEELATLSNMEEHGRIYVPYSYAFGVTVKALSLEVRTEIERLLYNSNTFRKA